ncbi:MAG: D-glycerate dehydrogenase [Thermoplasmatota archaeon]
MKIFLTRKIPQPGIDLLKENFELDINPENRVLTKKEIMKGIQGKDGLLCLLTDPIDKEVIEHEPNLKMIANYAVGYDNIDIQAATDKGIVVSNTPGVLTQATAEMAWALLFSVSRRIVEGDTYTRSGKFDGWDPMLLHGVQISNKTLAVIGTGRIGTAFAEKSKGFDMDILYVDETENRTLEQMLHAKKVDIKEALQTADFISLHVPLTDKTYHLIGEKELNMMKNTAVLINTSRGPVIDEKALITALKEKRIFGAGLDVYENEPTIPNELKTLQNVVLQPHSASATHTARTKMALIAAKNMIAGLNAEMPPNCINKEAFGKKTIG